MSSLIVRLRNARREPLPDRADIDVLSRSTGRVVGTKRGVSGTQALRFENLRGGDVYEVRAFPMRHRPVGLFVLAPVDGERGIELACPVHPERVLEAKFPEFADLPPSLRDVLQRSEVEGAPGLRDAALWDQLDVLQRAGLLNLHAKMVNVALADGTTCWSHVEALHRIRGDRAFADVSLTLRDKVKSGVASGAFRIVSGSLHTPPDGFAPASSFKTTEPYGNLQLTFFSGPGTPIRFRVDADIDDAAGIPHVFQVLRNWMTDAATHPFDIGEILVYSQWIDPGYRLQV